MTVSVATCSAKQLFAGHIIEGSNGKQLTGALVIPEYQRPYCWQNQQIDSLLEDLEAHFLKHNELSYYLGSLILHHDEQQLKIIDGQQRITTLALFGFLLQQNQKLDLRFESPLSQQQIKENLDWIENHKSKWAKLINFERIQFSLVVTESEDDAYRFFETQNTGGVRLGGPDIIKAHHLRAVPKVHQTRFALQWEGLGSLDNSVKSLLKGRYWQQLNMRELAPHQQTKVVRDQIVAELGEQTTDGGDIAYGQVLRLTGIGGEVVQQAAQQGYEVRQPLNAGINTIRYLAYFQNLYQQYWVNPTLPHQEGYNRFIFWLKGLEGCGYLQGLYEACLMMYISQFGEYQLESAAKKLFRVVYSRRVSNQKAVRENSISSFVRDYPVLDWIALSYTPKQCFTFFDAFNLVVDPNNLESDTNSVKKRFIAEVSKHFQLELSPEQYASSFANLLTRNITEMTEAA
ncbi:DUF262 domain-containing protein [Shewanella algae]|uniref:DUF262 domain-containing protein n=1 Tax=Shewanella algae TaxID=38313 RepID=UPI003B670986